MTRAFGTGGTEVWALRGVNLEVAPGEFLVIQGRSGSGKTTLLNMMGGLDRPTGGTVLFDGQDLAAASEAELTALRRQRVSFVFQFSGLLPLLSASENVELPLHISGVSRQERRRRTQESLEQVGLTARARHRPYELSGGEQQRVAIARAMVNHPRLLLADEPTGNLDTANSQAVLETLKSVCQRTGQTILMITHNPEAAAFCAGRVLRMTDGHIVEE